jgi:hypothetical protein
MAEIMETFVEKEEEDLYLLPRLVNEEPKIIDVSEKDYYFKKDLLTKVKIVVAFDLNIHDGVIVQYNDMSKVNQLRFKKQCTRIFDACLLSETDQQYITDRFNEIVCVTVLDSGCEISDKMVGNYYK